MATTSRSDSGAMLLTRYAGASDRSFEILTPSHQPLRSRPPPYLLSKSTHFYYSSHELQASQAFWHRQIMWHCLSVRKEQTVREIISWTLSGGVR
jgi:hypothetical protein